MDIQDMKIFIIALVAFMVLLGIVLLIHIAIKVNTIEDDITDWRFGGRFKNPDSETNLERGLGCLAREVKELNNRILMFEIKYGNNRKDD